MPQPDTLKSQTLEGFDATTLDNIADALAQQGYIVIPQALPDALAQSLQKRVQTLPPELWQQAGIGRKQAHQINAEIRSDKIIWIDPDQPAEAAFLTQMETLRRGINQRLQLGLFAYESHFATYPPGSYYRKHLDSLKGQSNRVLSTVYYLNNDWQVNDGGELLIYDKADDNALQSVLPHLGTLVIFLSENIPHEVLKARRQRFSIAGWFRVNSA